MAHYLDNDGNQITTIGKWAAGLLLCFFLILPALLIIGYWPDRMPSSSTKEQPYYQMKFFHVRLLSITDSCLSKMNAFCPANDTTKSIQVAKPVDTLKKDTLQTAYSPVEKNNIGQKEVAISNTQLDQLIHLNTLLLLLVASAGFLGNMVHIATSFTTFIGVGQFKKSWVMWYIVKPFVAAALAITLYFVLCGGFLSINNSPSNINIYGVVTIAIFAGLFSDRTTLKLKEVFEVLLKPKEERTDTLTSILKIVSVNQQTLQVGMENALVLSGKNMQEEKFTAMIADKEVSVIVDSPTNATIKYTIPPELLANTTLLLSIKNEKGIEIFKKVLSVIR